MQRLCDIHIDTNRINIYRIKKKQWVGDSPYYYKYEATFVVRARRPRWLANLFRCPEEYLTEFRVKQWGSSGDMMDFGQVPKYYSTDNLTEIYKDCTDIWAKCCEGPAKIEVIDK